MNKFEKVTSYKEVDFNLPTRKTKGAAGYDFEVAEDIIIPSYRKLFDVLLFNADPSNILTLEEMATVTKLTSAKPTLVPTGVKCQLDPGCYLELSVRSSSPLKYWLILANGVGIIDEDYYNNPDNEGHIYFQIINLSPFDIQLKRGDIIGQGIIHKYEIADGDEANSIRNGGFGSTSAAAQMAIEPQGNFLRGQRAKTNLINESSSSMDTEKLAGIIQEQLYKYTNAYTVGV